MSCSSEISREFREYERASTTALSAYVQPIIDGYLGRFEARLAREGFTGRFSIMQSNGGRLPAGAIRQNAITALFSGPGGGRHRRAIRQVGASGYRNLITFDMGGTSTDVCLVSDGKPIIAPETVDRRAARSARRSSTSRRSAPAAAASCGATPAACCASARVRAAPIPGPRATAAAARRRRSPTRT